MTILEFELREEREPPCRVPSIADTHSISHPRRTRQNQAQTCHCLEPCRVRGGPDALRRRARGLVVRANVEVRHFSRLHLEPIADAMADSHNSATVTLGGVVLVTVGGDLLVCRPGPIDTQVTEGLPCEAF